MIFKVYPTLGKKLHVCAGLVNMICDKKYGRKHAYSKLDGTKYSLEYISEYEYQRQIAEKIVIRINTQDIY